MTFPLRGAALICTAVVFAATPAATLRAEEPASKEPASKEPKAKKDGPLDRPVRLPRFKDAWLRIGEAVGEGIGLPVEVDRQGLALAGFMGSVVVPSPPDGLSGGSALWWCAVSTGLDEAAFVVHRDAAGRAQKIVFTSWSAAREAKTPPPLEARFLPGIVPLLEGRPDREAHAALQLLARFGAEAKDAIPSIEKYAGRQDVPAWRRTQAERVAVHIRKAVERKERPKKQEKPAPPPPAGDWLSMPVDLPRREYVVDELCEAITTRTAVPIVLRLDDFEQDERLVAGAMELESRGETVGALLWKLADREKLFVVLVRDAAGKQQRIEVTTREAAARRKESPAGEP